MPPLKSGRLEASNLARLRRLPSMMLSMLTPAPTGLLRSAAGLPIGDGCAIVVEGRRECGSIFARSMRIKESTLRLIKLITI